MSMNAVTLLGIRHINITCNYMPEGFVSINRFMKLLIQGLVVNMILRFNLVIFITFDILVIIYFKPTCGESKEKYIYILGYKELGSCKCLPE